MAASPALSCLYLSTATTWRGGENQLLLLAQGLLQGGHRPLLLAPGDSPLLARALAAGVPSESFLLRGEWDLFGMWRLKRLLRELSPEILHLNDAHAVLPGALAAKSIPRERLAVIAHRRTAFAIRSSRKYGGRLDRVLAISQAVRTALLRGGVSEDRIRVVYSGLEFTEEPCSRSAPRPPEAALLRRRLGLGPEDVLLAHAAALTSEKRQCDLVKALKWCMNQPPAASSPGTKLKGACIPAVHLAIAGEGPLETQLRAQARELGLGERVHFLGFLKDLQPLWRAAELAVFTSEAEGLCTSLVESQAAGLPAVVTRAGGMPEVVADGETGTVREVGDIPGLGEAIRQLALDPELRHAYGERASDRARRLFSAQAMVEGTLAAYREIRDQADPAVDASR